MDAMRWASRDQRQRRPVLRQPSPERQTVRPRCPPSRPVCFTSGLSLPPAARTSGSWDCSQEGKRGPVAHQDGPRLGSGSRRRVVPLHTHAVVLRRPRPAGGGPEPRTGAMPSFRGGGGARLGVTRHPLARATYSRVRGADRREGPRGRRARGGTRRGPRGRAAGLRARPGRGGALRLPGRPGSCVVLLAGFDGEPRPNEELVALRWFTREEVEAIGRAGLLHRAWSSSPSPRRSRSTAEECRLSDPAGARRAGHRRGRGIG